MLTTQSVVTDVNKEVQFQENGPYFKGLLDTPDLKLIMINMKKGQAVSWHRANVQITVFIDQGEINFGVRDKEHEAVHHLTESMSVTLPPNVEHNLTAYEDSVILVYKTPNPEKLVTLY